MEKELLDNSDSTMLEDSKKHEAEFVEKVQERERETGRQLEVVADENRDIRLPLKVLYEQERISLGRLPLWYLQALGSMTIKEYNEFVKSHQTELNINEIAASDLLTGVINHDHESVVRFWELQKALLKSKNVIQQVNQINIGRDSGLKNIMDDISAGLFDK